MTKIPSLDLDDRSGASFDYPEQDVTLLVKSPVYSGPRFTVWKGVFTRKGSDEQYIREWVTPGNVVAVLPFDGENLYLGRQLREVVGGQVLSLAAGVIDKGEEPEYAARRELREELGITAGKWTKIAGFYTSEGITDEFTHLYLAEDLTFGEATDLEERVDVVKVPFELAQSYASKSNNAKLTIALQWFENRQLNERLDDAVEDLTDLRAALTDLATPEGPRE